MYNEGISKTGDILDLGVQLELIEKRGSFYNYGETRLGQGRENAKQFLRENPGMAVEIEMAIRHDSGLLPGSSGLAEELDGEELNELELSGEDDGA